MIPSHFKAACIHHPATEEAESGPVWWEVISTYIEHQCLVKVAWATCRSAADWPSQRVETDANTAVSISRQPLDGESETAVFWVVSDILVDALVDVDVVVKQAQA